jgi:hypothetical protein
MHSNKLLYTIEGGYKDLVDHFMTMFMWPLSIFIKNRHINTVSIISGDKAGYCTALCLQKCLEYNNINHITIKNIPNMP